MSFWNALKKFFSSEPTGVRARDSKGRYVADDPTTANVNEAYKDGKKPTKKAPAKRGRGRPKGSKNKPKK